MLAIERNVLQGSNVCGIEGERLEKHFGVRQQIVSISAVLLVILGIPPLRLFLDG